MTRLRLLSALVATLALLALGAPAGAAVPLEGPPVAAADDHEECDRPAREVLLSAAAEDEQVRLPLQIERDWPVALGSCPGVRPGAQVRIPTSNGTTLCTMNFLYTGTDSQGRRYPYVGTAGHCVRATNGTSHWSSGPEARDRDNRRIGSFVYARLDANHDFALIRLDPGVSADPQMCHWGGPTGIRTDNPNSLQYMQHTGQGTGTSFVPGRTGVAPQGWHRPRDVFFTGVASPGDSGGPVTTYDGRAVGVLVSLTAYYATPAGVGNVRAMRLGPELQAAGQVLGQRLTLRTAPRL